MIRGTHLKTGILALFSIFLVFIIISFPKQAYHASLRGLQIWWDVVFPALLPFFITAELLVGFGVVHFLGVILEPLMRPLFRVPGVGGFVLSMGVASGYPMGAKLTTNLREQKMVSRIEGERLLAITSTSGPLFMFGAVAVGFFHDVRLGILIALAHYLGAFTVGILMRYYSPAQEREFRKKHKKIPFRGTLRRAFREMHQARVKDGRPLGTLMGDAVMNSIQTLLLVGGFIIVFSVVINVLGIIGITTLLALFVKILFMLIGIPADLSLAAVAGIFEITLGSQLSSETANVALVHKVALAGAIIAWSGLSVHAQVASLISKTDLRYLPYLIARLMHACFTAWFTYLLWKPYQHFIQKFDIPAFLSGENNPIERGWQGYHYLTGSIILCLIFLMCIFLVYRFTLKKLSI